jgi:molybdopterin-synthase adenylyltransferase
MEPSKTLPNHVRALPAQLIPTSDGAGMIVRRGLTQVKVCGPQARYLISALYARGTGTFTKEQLIATFSDNDREGAEDLLRRLLERNLFVTVAAGAPEFESPLDIFYWHFLPVAPDLRSKLETTRLTLVGVNEVASRFLRAIRSAGFRNITWLDDPALRSSANTSLDNTREPIEPAPVTGPHEKDILGAECVIAVSEFGGQEHLRRWNRACCAAGVIFVPALLHDLIGYIGPVVVPGQTSCFECLRGRQNSHLKNVADFRDVDSNAFQGRQIIALHPSMVGVLADVLAIEITKIFGVLPLGQANRCIEINLLRSEMFSRPVLKLPFCPVCGGQASSSPIDLSKFIVEGRENP